MAEYKIIQGGERKLIRFFVTAEEVRNFHKRLSELPENTYYEFATRVLSGTAVMKVGIEEFTAGRRSLSDVTQRGIWLEASAPSNDRDEVNRLINDMAKVAAYTKNTDLVELEIHSYSTRLVKVDLSAEEDGESRLDIDKLLQNVDLLRENLEEDKKRGFDTDEQIRELELFRKFVEEDKGMNIDELRRRWELVSGLIAEETNEVNNDGS